MHFRLQTAVLKLAGNTSSILVCCNFVAVPRHLPHVHGAFASYHVPYPKAKNGRAHITIRFYLGAPCAHFLELQAFIKPRKVAVVVGAQHRES